MTVITGKNRIKLSQAVARRAALKMEAIGLRRRGQSVMTILKNEYGWRGNRERIAALLDQEIDRLRLLVN